MNCFMNHFRCAFQRRQFLTMHIVRNATVPSLQGVRLYGSGGAGKDTKDMKKLMWKIVGLGTFFGAIGIGVYNRYIREPTEAHVLREREKALETSVVGSFDLIDQKRRRRRSTDYRGQWILLFFGFTRCKTVCPRQLEKVVSVITMLEKVSGTPRVTPIFITVDPMRDTPEVIGKYVREYSPKIVGLTGSYEEIEKTCKSYRVHLSAPSQNPEDDYEVDHSIVLYLINPKGAITEVYDQSKSADGIKNSVLLQVKDYENAEKKKPRWK